MSSSADQQKGREEINHLNQKNMGRKKPHPLLILQDWTQTSEKIPEDQLWTFLRILTVNSNLLIIHALSEQEVFVKTKANLSNLNYPFEIIKLFNIDVTIYIS